MGDILLVSREYLEDSHLGNDSLHEQDSDGICQAEIYAFNERRCVPQLRTAGSETQLPCYSYSLFSIYLFILFLWTLTSCKLCLTPLLYADLKNRASPWKTEGLKRWPIWSFPGLKLYGPFILILILEIFHFFLTLSNPSWTVPE